MKFSIFFFISAMFHGVVFLLPASRTEVGGQRIFPVTIMALSEARSARSPQRKKKLQKAEARTRQTTPRTEAIADARSAAVKKVVAAATTPPVAAGAQASEAAVPPEAPATAVKPEPQEVEADSTGNPEPGLLYAQAPREGAPPAAAPSVAMSPRDVSVAVAKVPLKRNAPVTTGNGEDFQSSFPITTAPRNPPAEPVREPRLPENEPGVPGDETPKPVAKSPARYAYNPPPVYPASARRDGSQGSVILSVLVDAEGRPEKIEISRSSGIQSLDEAAIMSVHDWRFHPARDGDMPVPSWVKIPVIFQLAGR